MNKTAIEYAQAMEYTRIVEEHKRRAKKAIVKDKIAEYVSQGINKEIAKVMASVFYEYEI